MRRKITLEAGDSYPVDVSSRINYLIIREATGNVLFGNDNLQYVELSRSDKAVITIYQGSRVMFVNKNAERITVEFQFSHIPLSIEEQETSIKDAVTVDEILKPVTVSEVLEPITVGSVTQPVPVDNTKENPLFVSNDYQRFTKNWTTMKDGNRLLYGPIMYLMIQAHEENKGDVTFAGIKIPPGGFYEVNHCWNSASETVDFDIDHLSTDKANVFWVRDMSNFFYGLNRDYSDAAYVVQGDKRIHYSEVI